MSLNHLSDCIWSAEAAYDELKTCLKKIIQMHFFVFLKQPNVISHYSWVLFK